MTTRAQLRKTALTFQEVEEVAADGVVTYRVRGKAFASLTKGGMVRLRLPEAKAKEAVAAYPKADDKTPQQRDSCPRPLGHGIERSLAAPQASYGAVESASTAFCRFG
jgi:hypothetical protein